MPRKQVYNKSEIPQWYRKRIKGFEDLGETQAIYQYERVKLKERVRRAKKAGYQYNLPPEIPAEKVTPYDIADVQAITRRDFVKVYDNREEAKYWFEELKKHTLETTEDSAQGWLELKQYKRKSRRGGYSKGGQWLANNTRRAGQLIIDKINQIQSDANIAPLVYDYHLRGSRYQTITRRIDQLLRDSSTAIGKFGSIYDFLADLSTAPLGVKESRLNNDTLAPDYGEEDEEFD